jgi:trans-aconitate methyltransferase
MEGTASGHWREVWSAADPAQVSWFQPEAATSLDLIARFAPPEQPAGSATSVVDVGGGASRLVDGLLDHGYGDVTVMDIAPEALEVSRTRLGARAATVTWVTADLLRWTPERTFGVWHDRAVLHFLTDPTDQAIYAGLVDAAVEPGGLVVIGVFAPDGPERCSGLAVQRHDADSVSRLLGSRFEVLEKFVEDHATPAGMSQRFSWVALRG